MDKKPLISILTPVFNQRLYIEQTIQSVLNQTYQHWEWVILDDGSTDGTGDIIKKYKDSRIRYAFQEHAGFDNFIKTCNKALSFCNGGLIALLDSDDYWPLNKLEVQIKSFENPDVILSYGECCMVDQKGKKIGYMSIPDDARIASNNPVGSSLKLIMLQRYCFIHNSTILVKKSTLLDIGGFIKAQGLFQDLPTLTRLTLEGRFYPLPVCLGYYRRHPSSSSLNRNPELMFRAGINFFKEFFCQNEKRINSLGFFYDLNTLEKHWENLIRKFVAYLPYNRSLEMLRISLFKEAKTEMKKFLEIYPSFKHRLIYSLLVFSGLFKIDMVNPLSDLTGKAITFLKNFSKNVK